jgi:hypothetical protein
MNRLPTRRRGRRGLPLLLLTFLGACSWDYTKLSPQAFRDNLCGVLDNFQKHAAANAAAIQDPVARAAAFNQVNNSLAQLAAAKLQAVNAYSNCNEAQLKAAQATAERIIEGLMKALGANLKNPLGQIDFNTQGNKQAGPGPHRLVSAGGSMRLQAGQQPTPPLSWQGDAAVDLVPAGSGYQGQVHSVAWTVTLPGVASWNVTLQPDPSNALTLQRQLSGGFTGSMHLNLLVDGRGITWPIVVDLPLTMDATETRWSIASGGLVPANRYFPEVPPANSHYGRGCLGGLSAPVEINPTSVLRVGDPFTVRVDGGPANSFSTLSVGFARTTLDVSFLFGPGCSLLATPDLMLMAPVLGGTAFHTLPIPPDPNLTGLTLHMQAVVLDPGSGFRGGMTGGLTQTTHAR